MWWCGRFTSIFFFFFFLFFSSCLQVNPLNGVANDYDTNRLRYSTPVAVANWYMSAKRRYCAASGCGNFDIAWEHPLSLLICTHFQSLHHHPAHAVRCALLGARAYLMLYSIRAFRHMCPKTRLRHELLECSHKGPMSQTSTKSDDFLDDVLEGNVGLGENWNLDGFSPVLPGSRAFHSSVLTHTRRGMGSVLAAMRIGC